MCHRATEMRTDARVVCALAAIASAACASAPSAGRVGEARASRSAVESMEADDRRAIAALLDSATDAARRRDAAALRRMLTPGFAFVHSTGRVDDVGAFVAFVGAVRQDSMRTLGDARWQRSGDAAVVVSEEATYVARRGWTAFRASDVVVRDGSGWRWMLHHSTALPGMPGVAVTLPDSALDALVGEFATASGAVRTVKRDGDHLTITAANGAPLVYRALSPTTFHAERGDAYAVFVRSGGGRVEWLEILQPTGYERLRRVESSP